MFSTNALFYCARSTTCTKSDIHKDLFKMRKLKTVSVILKLQTRLILHSICSQSNVYVAMYGVSNYLFYKRKLFSCEFVIRLNTR